MPINTDRLGKCLIENGYAGFISGAHAHLLGANKVHKQPVVN